MFIAVVYVIPTPLASCTLRYLHGNHPSHPLVEQASSSTFATTNSSGAFSGQEWYNAYGRFRGGHELGTAPNGNPRFTGHPSALLRNQKLDREPTGRGLMYFNAQG